MCTGSPPLCSESPWPACRSLALGHSRKWNHALVAQMEERLPCKQRVARSNRRLGHQTCRVRLAGRGLLSFKEATRVRIPYTMPNQKSCVLTRGTETGLKDRGAPELVTGLDMDRCPSGSRGSPAKGEPASPARAFESLTIRQDIGGVAQSAEHLPCKQAVAGSMPVASTRRWFVSSVEERLPVEERAAGSIPARTASTCRNSSEVERCVESAGVGVSKTPCGTSKLRPASSAEESTGLRSRGSHVQIVRGAPIPGLRAELVTAAACKAVVLVACVVRVHGNPPVLQMQEAMAERSKAADCKSAVSTPREFESRSPLHFIPQ